MSNTDTAVDGGEERLENESWDAPTTAKQNGGSGEHSDASETRDARPATTNGVGEGESEASCESDERGDYSLVAPHTRGLKRLANAWMEARKRKQALKQRWSWKDGNSRVWESAVAEKEHEQAKYIYGRWSREVKKSLKEHPLWTFLSDLPGLSGPTTAYLVGQIRDPWRFPGQRCEEGHYLRPIFDVGEPCPIKVKAEDEGRDGRCGAPTLKPRPGTGVRALWHYCGLFPGANKRQGHQTSWDPELKGLCLAPDTGLAAQIVRQKPEPYRSTYDEEKERLIRERGYRSDGEVVEAVAPTDENESGADAPPPLIKLDRIARTIAVKEFVGDLLMAWKTVQDPEDY